MFGLQPRSETGCTTHERKSARLRIKGTPKFFGAECVAHPADVPFVSELIFWCRHKRRIASNERASHPDFWCGLSDKSRERLNANDVF